MGGSSVNVEGLSAPRRKPGLALPHSKPMVSPSLSQSRVAKVPFQPGSFFLHIESRFMSQFPIAVIAEFVAPRPAPCNLMRLEEAAATNTW